MRVILISGKAQNGKDTTAFMMKAELESSGSRVLLVHYADLLKYICRSFFGWDGEKDDYGRSLLQRVGTDVIRAKDPDYWVRFIAQILTLFQSEWDYVLIPDCRFPNEIDFLTDAGFDVLHLRVVREQFTSTLSAEQQKHPSETALDHRHPDAYIHNSGSLEELYDEVRSIVDAITGRQQMRLEFDI